MQYLQTIYEPFINIYLSTPNSKLVALTSLLAILILIRSYFCRLPETFINTKYCFLTYTILFIITIGAFFSIGLLAVSCTMLLLNLVSENNLKYLAGYLFFKGILISIITIIVVYTLKEIEIILNKLNAMALEDAVIRITITIVAILIFIIVI